MHLYRQPEKGDMLILNCGTTPSSHMIRKVKGAPLVTVKYFPKCECGSNEVLLFDENIQDIIYKEML